MLPLLNQLWRSPLGPKFARSVPLRLGVARVPRTCYGFCVRGLCGATTRLVLSAGCVAWSFTLAARPVVCPNGFEDRGGGQFTQRWPRNWDGHEAYYRLCSR